MDETMKVFEEKAAILVDALPYIRDFNQKVVVIQYGCCNVLNYPQEKSVMQDIALLKSIGMKPIVVHDTRMGVDSFRENKRIAKMIEYCGVKAVGVCGVDFQTIAITLDNDYIPVITPNDIDTEHEKILPEDTAAYIATRLQADKLVFLSEYDGIHDGKTNELLSVVTLEQAEAAQEEQDYPEDLKIKLKNVIYASKEGVNRVHFIDGRIPNCILLEFFSKKGIGTVVIHDESRLYAHELE